MLSPPIQLLLVAALLVPACGRKADPQPPELVRPRTIVNLVGDASADGVRLRWTRPNEYVNGRRMDDLGGFLVFRGAPGMIAQELADIPVADRERFQREKKFEYLDRRIGPGRTYYYRIVSYTTDHYYSDPSNQVTIAIGSSGGAAAPQEPPPTPAPAPRARKPPPGGKPATGGLLGR
jgi:hypothetical protein